MITSGLPSRHPTKQRLMEAGVRLFAANGFQETTVGDIEAAAGLEPRRGALYRHFTSKEALLEAALEAHLQGMAGAGLDLTQLRDLDPHEAALQLGRRLLEEVDREQAIVRILEQDGDRLGTLRDHFRAELVEPGYRLTAELLGLLGADPASADVDARAGVLLGALVNYRRSTWTFGRPPADLDEERFLSTWATACVAFAR